MGHVSRIRSSIIFETIGFVWKLREAQTMLKSPTRVSYQPRFQHSTLQFKEVIKEAISATEDKTGFGGIHCPSAPLLQRRKQLQALKWGFY